MNISSIVIKCAPEYLESVLSTLQVENHCEVYFHDPLGRIVAVIEGASIEEETEKFALIQQTPHILSVEMAMVFSDNEFSQESEKLGLSKKDKITSLNHLNDDTVNAHEIVYSGHVKDKYI